MVTTQTDELRLVSCNVNCMFNLTPNHKHSTAVVLCTWDDSNYVNLFLPLLGVTYFSRSVKMQC